MDPATQSTETHADTRADSPAQSAQSAQAAEPAAVDLLSDEDFEFGPDLPVESPHAAAEAALDFADGSSDNLPVPVSDVTTTTRRSLWRRLTFRSAATTPAKERVTNEALRTRLDGIALRLESLERAIAQGEHRLDERLARLWEIEEQLEQLTDLGERTVEARDAAQEAAASSRSIAGTVRALAVMVGISLAAATALAAYTFLLPLLL
jgi:hypothetical protein